jgi:hypothetical protein
MTLSPRALFLALALAAPLAAQNQGIQLTTGIDGGVDCPFDVRMVPPTGITVEAWITYDDSTVPTGGNYWPTIARQNITPNQESWNFRVSAGSTAARNLQFIVRTAANQLFAATYFFTPGEFTSWTHVAASWDGTTIRIFKSGAQVAQATTPQSEVQNNAGTLRIGNGDPVLPGNESWNGSIDEVRIWPMARSAGEILASRDQELPQFATDVLTFQLNGTYASLDNTVTGVPFGGVAFVPGAPALVPQSAVILSLAQPSSTCARKPVMLLGSLPQVGNTAFTMWCVRGPTPATSLAGVLFAGAAAAPSTQPVVLGLEVAFDLGTLLASAAIAPPTNALGNASFNLAIPANPGLVGLSWVFQYLFLDNVCGAQGFTSSNGVLFAIQ